MVRPAYVITDPRLGRMDEGGAGAAGFGVEALAESRREVPELLWRDSIGSTNTELVRLAAEQELAAFTTLATTDQTAGRGRLDRSWVAPAGSALAVSVLVRSASAAGLGWLPLAAGAAMFDAVASVLPPGVGVGIKWPNDLQLDGRKVCGILSELVPANAASPGVAVVIGAGLNLTMSAEELPVPTATSLALAGADAGQGAALLDRVLSAYLRSLKVLVEGLLRSDGDAVRSGLHAAVVERCTTIGREVRVELPGGEQLHGRAVGIDDIGRLEVRDDAELLTAVAAGDIVHLR